MILRERMECRREEDVQFIKNIERADWTMRGCTPDPRFDAEDTRSTRHATEISQANENCRRGTVWTIETLLAIGTAWLLEPLLQRAGVDHCAVWK